MYQCIWKKGNGIVHLMVLYLISSVRQIKFMQYTNIKKYNHLRNSIQKYINIPFYFFRACNIYQKKKKNSLEIKYICVFNNTNILFMAGLRDKNEFSCCICISYASNQKNIQTCRCFGVSKINENMWIHFSYTAFVLFLLLSQMSAKINNFCKNNKNQEFFLFFFYSFFFIHKHNSLDFGLVDKQFNCNWQKNFYQSQF